MGRIHRKEVSKANVHAYWRNLCKTHRHLLETGAIERDVLIKDDSRLADEGASRYGVSPEDRDALRSYLRYDQHARQPR